MAGKKKSTPIPLQSLDALFGTTSDEQAGIQQIALDNLHPFSNHPFKVLDDDKMTELSESVRTHGVLVPGIVRIKDTGGYEIIAGHRRKRACEIAGLKTMPVIIKDLTDDESTVIMVDSNIQREELLISEKAFAYRYIPFLKDIIDEECEESPRAEELLEKLKAYQPEIPDTAVPIVRINFCEDKEMDISGYQKLGNLDETTAKMDAELASNADPKTGMPEKTVQMYFTIYYPDRDQMQELKGKINIGDGNGGIVSQLKNQNEMKLHDESWLNYQKGKGEESFQAYMADLTDMQEHVLPYLQSFCSMEERAPEASDQSVNISKSEMESGKITMSGQNKRTKTVETGKKSIHERLQINKEIISKQQGKISKEKGVELMKE